MKYFYRLGLFLGLMVQALLRPAAAVAAPFTAGNIVVARVGDGTTVVAGTSAAIFLDEYTPTGTLVQSIALPTAINGNNRSLTVTTNGTSELPLTRSADGRYLLLAGYGVTPGYGNVVASTSTDVVRVVGVIGADGSVNTATSLGEAFSATNVRGVASPDGQNLYVVGGNSGVQYITRGGFNPVQLNTALPTNLRVIDIVDGNLYVTSASGGFIGVNQVGTGLPTTAGQTITLLPGGPGNVGTSQQSPYDFYFADLSPTVAGSDVVYVVDSRTNNATGSGIQKWSLVNNTWVLNGTIPNTTAVSLTGLDGSVSGTSVSLLATSATSLYTLTDNTGYNAAPTIPLPAAVVTLPAGSNKVFRGISFAPFAAAPTITSFTPTSGVADGTVIVTVTGTNFTGASTVTLNGVAITGFTVVNSTTITFAVPTGATSGPIAVTTVGGTATSTSSFTVTGAANPTPVITSLSPNTTVAGNAAFTLTVNGTGFVSSSVVNFNSTALTTTFVSATQLTAAVPASAVATAGTYNVTVTSPTPGGGTSAAATFTVTTPAPTITSFTPTSGVADGSVTVTVTGTDFTGATAVTLNGVAITGFTVVNSTTITFTVPTGATSGTIAVTTPTGTATSTGTFTVVVPNATPTITSLTPNTAAAGSAGFTLTVNGTGFISSTVINFNSTALATTYVSATQVAALVPATAVATVGTYAVTATNPAPGGGTSAGVNFTVTTPAPTITSFTPTSGLANGTVTVTVTGTDFTGATAVTLNGVAITGFTVVNSTTITFAVPTGATSGTIAITTPAGTATSTASFIVTPTITALSPNAQVVGGSALTLTITGTNFTSASTVNFNNVSYTPTSTTATTIVVTIPASVLNTLGAYPVSVTTAGGTSNVFTFTVSNPSTAGAYENFEAGTKTSYTAGTVTLTSGIWNFSNALIGDTFADKFNGVKSARIRTGGFIAMNFDKPNGAGTVIINAALYGTTDTGASFLLEQSTDGGLTYTTVAGAPATLTATLTPYTFTVNTGGNVRFRISNTVTTTTATAPRINIDDISISNFTAAPTITSFTPTTGGPGTTVTVTGTNLTGATAVRIGTFTVTNFTVVNGTTITFVVPSGTGSVSGFISVTTPGGTATSTTPFNLVSATLAANALPGLSVFPNPAIDRLTVELPTSAAATVALRDLAGRLVLAPIALGADHQLLLPASLASGVYLLEVRQGTAVAIRRIEKN